MAKSSPVHGSCVVFNNKGLLILGPSGSGKSDLAFRLLNQGAWLVADDQVIMDLKESKVFATAPSTLKGLLEVRGMGVETFPYLERFPIHGVINLKPIHEIERYPLSLKMTSLQGVNIPTFDLWAFEAAIIEKIKLLCLKL